MLLTSSFATVQQHSTITHEKRQDIAIMSRGHARIRGPAALHIESAIIGFCRILVGCLIGYRQVWYGWSHQ